jgi:hypothetical protein
MFQYFGNLHNRGGGIMSKLYKTIISLCESRGISGYRMCKEIGIQPSILTDLKMGRKEGLSSKNADKIARFFGVPVGYLLGTVTLNDDGCSFSDGSGFGGGSGSGAGLGNGTGYGGPMPIKRNKKAPTSHGERSVSDDDIKFALFGGDGDITDAMYDEVRKFAAFVKQREADKKKE